MQRPLPLRPRAGLVIALCLSTTAAGSLACSPAPSPGPQAAGPLDDFITNQKVQALPNSQCGWASSSGTLTITVTSGQTAVVSRKTMADGGAILVNGAPCPTTASITADTLNALSISGSTGNEVVVLDYLNGFFALASASHPAYGTTISLGGGTDLVAIRTSGADDQIYCGQSAGTGTPNQCNLAQGDEHNLADLKSLSGVESMLVSLGAGSDVFSAAGGSTGFPATTTALTIPLVIHGGPGDDTLTGGKGADTLYGELGDDILGGEASATYGADTFDGGGGTDTLTYAARTTGVRITLDATANDGDAGGAGEHDNVKSNIEAFVGGEGADTIDCRAATFAVDIRGHGGDDTIYGSLFDDTLLGGAGNDLIDQGTTADGADIIHGEEGTDTVSYAGRTAAVSVFIGVGATSGDPAAGGGAGERDDVDVENVIGGSGDDTITGDDADNVITGGAGDDTLKGGLGNDTFLEAQASLTTSSGTDDMDGEGGTDTISYYGRTSGVTINLATGAGNGDPTANSGAGEGDSIQNVEKVIGTDSADDITGTSETDDIQGKGGADTIDSGDGDDTIDGGPGIDTITCGPGADTVNSSAGDTIDPSCESLP